MNRLYLLLDTIKFLKPIQFKYRLYYLLRKKFRQIIHFYYPSKKESLVKKIKIINGIYNHQSYYQNGNFKFINLTKNFKVIDWDYNEYGKLWTYNLTYFEYLNQKEISKEEGINLIQNYIKYFISIKSGNEPFPTSLRIINWIKFLTKHNIEDKEIQDSLYAQAYILTDNLEYHLLGNHLLENSFALLFASYYFQDDKLYALAKKILNKELEEQILNDGAHFERTPMYHQLMLYRVLDAINLIKNNSWKNKELLKLLVAKAKIMLGWLEEISYQDGSIPLFNDSTNKIAPTTEELFNYAKILELRRSKITLQESGYRKYTTSNYEIIIDIGDIGPDYIPGHAHSDTFNFELSIKNQPFIVDTGLSTYQSNEIRAYERSTKAHNTVEINNKEQSEVWGAFRVANRAKVIKVKESNHFIEAIHNGYKKENILHTRRWSFQKKSIIIEDFLTQKAHAVARVHFHPNVSKEEILTRVKTNQKRYNITTYNYAPEFNTYQKGFVLEISFKKELKMEIFL